MSEQTGGLFREATEEVPLDDAAVNFEEITDLAASAFRVLEYKRFVRTSPTDDMETFLQDFNALLNRTLVRLVATHRNIRTNVCVHAAYEKIGHAEHPLINGYLRTYMTSVIGAREIRSVAHRIVTTIRSRHVNFMRESSGLRLAEVRVVDIYSAVYDPLKHAGSGYVELPKFLESKKAIVNVKNSDNRCFGYALLSALHPTANRHPNRAAAYDAYFDKHPRLRDLTYPVWLEQLEGVEKKIGISFNVFSFFDDEGRGRHPVFLSHLNSVVPAINLLFWKGHYAWVKHFSRFLGDTNTNAHRRFYCERCLGHFTKESVLDDHLFFCQSIDTFKQVFTMPEEGTKLSFYNVCFQQRLPFIVFADFEALTEPWNRCGTDVDRRAGVPLTAYQTHKPISVGLKLVSSAAGTLDDEPYETYTGGKVVEWFLARLLDYRTRCFDYLFDPQRLVMTAEDEDDFECATECYICGEAFPTGDAVKKMDSKVRDHDHITGKYRGAAHSRCNLKLRKIYKLPVFLHNFRGYDSHLIVPALTAFKGTNIQVIGQNLEKYLTLTWDDTVVFKDSLQFVNGSLEALVDCLRKSGKANFRQLRSGFATQTDEEGLDLLSRKGVYPYDYMSCEARLNEEHLPARVDFFSKLQNRACSEEDYAHAQHVWNKFGCKTMLDYHNLYLKTDVLLLADVFESFRTTTLSTFGLDPAYYVSAPQLSWDCMMKMTKCELTLLNDPAMFSVINDNLRGGISMIVKRHAVANNKYMGTAYDPAVRSSYILYLDANNLYGWAMSEPLPYDDFQWVTEQECAHIDWRTQTDDQEIGYFVECDMSYPDHLHGEHNAYPLAPERVVVEDYMLSRTQRELRTHYDISHAATSKLIPNLNSKSKMLVHYRNLRFYLEHGLVLARVHKAIRFKQSRWLRPYIQTNTELRAKSKDPVETKFRKDMNNSVYGKTCENLTKRTDIRLVTTKRQCEVLINKPHCLRFQIFTPELAAVELQKVKCLINKPTYVGFAVLELSKLLMYKFHYDQLQTWFDRADLLFTDTDSLVYQIYTDDLYADLAARREHFDFSSYPPSHPLFGDENKMALGKMKDESSGEIITEFVGLRPKMYSYTTMKKVPEHGEAPVLKEARRAKGIQRAAAEAIKHADYVAQLRAPVENYVNIRRIGQKHHRVFTEAMQKRGLCAFDDKRYLEIDGIHTIAHGHHYIRSRQRPETLFEEDDLGADGLPSLSDIFGTETDTSSMIGSADSELTSRDFIALDAQQARERNMRVMQYEETIDNIAGVDLRLQLENARRRLGQSATEVSAPPRAKRTKLHGSAAELDDEVDRDLALVTDVTETIALNDAF